MPLKLIEEEKMDVIVNGYDVSILAAALTAFIEVSVAAIVFKALWR